MADITVDVSEWEEFAKALTRDTDKLLDKHMLNAMESSLNFLTELIAPETPVGATGALRGSVAWEIFGTGFGMTGYAGPSAAVLYGLPVETGRAPGKAPIVEDTWQAVPALQLWVVRKLGLSGAEAEKAAYLIARAIGARGTKGAHMVEKAFDRAVGGKEIEEYWGYELERFIEELGP